MLARSDIAPSPAIDGSGISAVDESTDGKSAVGDEHWFSRAARILLPAKAGTALHYETGFDERLCQRYAAGHVKPPAYFFRALLRTEGGWQWLCAAMEGSDAEWFRQVKRGRRIAEAADEPD
jgi:hypothetical protein